MADMLELYGEDGAVVHAVELNLVDRASPALHDLALALDRLTFEVDRERRAPPVCTHCGAPPTREDREACRYCGTLRRAPAPPVDLLAASVVTVNEVRAQHGLPPVADVHVVLDGEAIAASVRERTDVAPDKPVFG